MPNPARAFYSYTDDEHYVEISVFVENKFEDNTHPLSEDALENYLKQAAQDAIAAASETVS